MNWRGRALISQEVIVQRIARTKTRSGLTAGSKIDTNSYAKGVVGSDADGRQPATPISPASS